MKIQRNTSESGIKSVCLNARSIINKKTELNIMVDDIKPCSGLANGSEPLSDVAP